MAQPEYVNPPAVAAPDGHFAQAAIAPAGKRLLFVSGQVPRARDGSTVGAGDMRAQAEQVFANLAAILSAHGAGFRDVVKATLFVTDLSQMDALMDVRRRHYGDATPASTLVGVAALGDPDWLLEVELVAAID